MSLSPPRSPKPSLDLGRRLGADRHLQLEIDKGLASLSEGTEPETGLRIARVLSAVLEPSWSEHADFQDEALFPLIARARNATLETRALLNRLSQEHVEIGARHREVTIILNDLIASRNAPDEELFSSVSGVLAVRRRHHEAESALEEMVPAELASGERAALDRWVASRDAPPFPVNLILDYWT